MANVNHNTLTDPYLHEPKGVSTAITGQIYVANGAGSGSWLHAHHYFGGYVTFDATTPAYSHSVTTSFTALNPTFAEAVNSGFTAVATPNARIVYNDVETLTTTIVFNINYKNSSGTSKDLELAISRNGVLLPGGHILLTCTNNDWKSATATTTLDLNQNDYIEVLVKGPTAFTLQLASASMNLIGVPSL